MAKSKDQKVQGFYEPPSEKARRYANELKNGANSLTGEVLNHGTASYRIGYLKSRKQQSAARRAYAQKHKTNS